MKINKDYLFGKREIDMMKLSGMKPIGITVHNTYNSAPALNEAKNQYNNNTKKGSNGAAVHFFIDEDNIYQLLPLDIHGWHAGDGVNGTGNRKTIAIEICRSTDYSDDKYARAEQKTVLFIQKLLKEYNFTTKDIYQHKHWSGKNCPHRLLEGNPINWETFINLINKGEIDKPTEKPVDKPSEPKGTYKEKGRFTCKEKVGIITRDYPSTSSKRLGQLSHNVSFDYDRVFIGNGYVWVSNGKVWIPTGQASNGKRNGKVWGVFGSQTVNKPVQPPKPQLRDGAKVQIKSSATKYVTGQSIPVRYKNKTYTVLQLNKNKSQALIKELMSWVYAKDLIVL